MIFRRESRRELIRQLEEVRSTRIRLALAGGTVLDASLSELTLMARFVTHDGPTVVHAPDGVVTVGLYIGGKQVL